jgi:hypothetical protein
MEPPEIGTVAAGQHGLLTREQALDAGLTPRQVQRRLEAGRWRIIRPGVFVIVGAPASRQQAVLAACLSTGAAASHLTAADLWGLGFPTPDSVDLLTRFRWSKQDGTRSHRTRTLLGSDITTIGAIPVTSPERTIVDVAGTVAAPRLGPLVRNALRRGIVRLAALRECHRRVDNGPGRRSTLALRDVLNEITPNALGDSERELHLVRVISAAQLPAPILGHPVSAAGHRYRLDLAWPAQQLAVEFDGWAHHKGFDAFHDDRQRLRHLVADGWTIVPATARTPDSELVHDLTRLLCASCPTPAVVRDAERRAGVRRGG